MMITNDGTGEAATGPSGSVLDRVTALVAPIVGDLGLDLYDLEFAGGTLKITVDTHPGSPGGVDVDQLSRVTRLVSRELDHVDPIPGHYTLEVSSPGLERNLRLPRHFAREIGKSVAVRLRHATGGERRVSGVLTASGPESFTVLDDQGGAREIRYDDVDRARTIFVWEAQDKPGKKGAKKGAEKGASARPKGPGHVGRTSSSAASPADFQAERAAGGSLDETSGATPGEFTDWDEDQENAES